jgi:hypothetical protein
MGSLPDDDAPLMETHGLHFMPATDTGEAPQGHTRAVPWSVKEAKMSATLGLRAVLVVKADVERIGTKIHMSNYNCYLVEGLPADVKANVKRLVTPTTFKMILDRFYDDLQGKGKRP